MSRVPRARTPAATVFCRVVTNTGTLDGATHYVHDRSGNVIAELDSSGASVSEYIWLPRAPIVRARPQGRMERERESAAPNKEPRSRRRRPCGHRSTGRWLWWTAWISRSWRAPLALLAAPPRGRCFRSGGPWPSPATLVARPAVAILLAVGTSRASDERSAEGARRTGACAPIGRALYSEAVNRQRNTRSHAPSGGRSGREDNAKLSWPC